MLAISIRFRPLSTLPWQAPSMLTMRQLPGFITAMVQDVYQTVRRLLWNGSFEGSKSRTTCSMPTLCKGCSSPGHMSWLRTRQRDTMRWRDSIPSAPLEGWERWSRGLTEIRIPPRWFVVLCWRSSEPTARVTSDMS